MKASVQHLAILLGIGMWSQFGWSQNLVPNPGFEGFSSCPSTSCEWFLATDWDNVNGFVGCNNGNSGSPDYFNACGSGFFSTPNTLNGLVSPLGGNGIMGLATWLGLRTDFREYLQVPLTLPLVAGDLYTLSFSYTNGNFDPSLSYGGHGTELGVHFSVGPLTQTGSDPIILTPTFETTGAVFNSGWQTITVTFTAPTNATHLTIGNFRDDANSTIQQFASPSGSFGYAFYYFDEISVLEENPLSVEWLNVEATAAPNEARLTWVVAPLTNEARFVIERSEDGQVFVPMGERQGVPGEMEFAFRDTDIVQDTYDYRIRYEGLDGSRSMSRSLQVRWTPSTDFAWYHEEGKRRLVIKQAPAIGSPIDFRIYDLNGRSAHQGQSQAGKIGIPNNLPPGMYLIHLSQNGHSLRDKVWVR
ncbi:MAG: T9SS type A sorting domain-containing protein [Bacteroidota bacterium]